MEKQTMGFSTKKSYNIPSPGKHIVQVTKAVLGESSSGYAMISVRYHVVEGPAKGLSFRDWIVIGTNRGLDKLVEFCSAAGIEGVDDAGPAGLDPWNQRSIVDNLLGKCVVCNIKHEEGEYRGEKQVNARPDGFFPLPDEKVAEYAERFADYGGNPPLPKDALRDFSNEDINLNFRMRDPNDTSPQPDEDQTPRYKEKPATAESFDDGFGDEDIPF